MLRFRLFRVPVLVHPSLWITLALFGKIWGIDCISSFLSVLYFMLAGLICVLIHALAHAVVGRYLGGGQPQILLSALGGECCNPDARLSRYQGILMTITGPLATACIGLLAMGVIYLANGLCVDNLMTRTLMYINGEVPHFSLNILPVGVMGLLRSLIMVSFWWTLLNMIPIYPLCGGQILCGLMDTEHMGMAHAVGIYAASLCGLAFFFLGWWMLCVFMIILLYINVRWWKLFKSARHD